MRTDAFDFDLPEHLIALRPADRRDAARLLSVAIGHNQTAFSDHTVGDLARLLSPGDTLVLNDTKVLPALLHGVRHRGDSNVSVSVNLLERLAADRWSALAKPARRLRAGDRLVFHADLTASTGETLDATITDCGAGGQIELAFEAAGDALDAALDRVGSMPLPHYIAAKRRPDDRDRADYQTLFAAKAGAVAAPTAGLHFTPEVFAALEARGIACTTATLHVGGGTFLPVKAETTDGHVMHEEWGEVSDDTAHCLNACRQAGGNIVAVGTTSLRLLEAAAGADGRLAAFKGATGIFITPGYTFKVVDRLVTNFHLPRSTLFMLVAAFSGLETMKQAYAHAIRSGYRFYSYGDACLLDRRREP